MDIKTGAESASEVDFVCHWRGRNHRRHRKHTFLAEAYRESRRYHHLHLQVHTLVCGAGFDRLGGVYHNQGGVDQVRYRSDSDTRTFLSPSTKHIVLESHQLYSSLLAFLNVFASAKTGLICSFHLTVVTLSVCGVYAYRDVWPLMTFPLRPVDEAEGGILWAKVALVMFISLVEPAFEPYPYIPVDPKVSKRGVRMV